MDAGVSWHATRKSAALGLRAGLTKLDKGAGRHSKACTQPCQPARHTPGHPVYLSLVARCTHTGAVLLQQAGVS